MTPNTTTPNTMTPGAMTPGAMTSSTTTTTTTSTAPEANVRTLSTPAPAAATTTAPVAEPKPQPVTPVPAERQAPSATTTSPSGPLEITCREERLEITTEWHTVGTAKLRKYVTSEQVERRVPVVRERVRVERMPVSEAERASLTEKEIAEAVEEVTLREERPVVRKYLAPIERVRLVVERYTDEEVVRDELRREHVEVQDSTPGAPAPDLPAAGVPAVDGSRPAAAMRPLS
ncbi:YsnF/AvaK domain-containing protein [Kitasatospora sp. NPDC051170]|uniref:YsnF/AvaK domain-containing protein n=1 Tax=Kitasatospora sp. NPDC051170 TaxID=3364056 RepID=UPI0037BB54F7